MLIAERGMLGAKPRNGVFVLRLGFDEQRRDEIATHQVRTAAVLETASSESLWHAVVVGPLTRA